MNRKIMRRSLQTFTLMEALVIAGGMFAFMMLAFTSLTWPYDRDQGIIGWVAAEILRGGIPYKDAWDVKGPLPYYIYALGQYWSEGDAWGIRAINLVLLLYTMLGFGFLVKHVTGDRVLSWVLSYILGAWFLMTPYLAAQPDGWVGMLMVGMVIVLLRDKGELRLSSALSIGVITGLMVLIKPNYILLSAVAGIYGLQYGLRHRRLTKDAIVFFAIIASVIIAIIALCAIFFWYHDALDDLIDAVFIYNIGTHRHYFTQLDVSGDLYPLVTRQLTQQAMIIPVFTMLAGVSVMFRRVDAMRYVCAAWLCLGCAIIVMQHKYFLYHFYVIFPVILLFFSLAVKDLMELTHRYIGQAMCVIALIMAYHPLVDPMGDAYRLARGTATFESYEKNSHIVTLDRTNHNGLEMADYIESQTHADNPFYMVGFDPIVHLWADRPSASNYGFIMPFLAARGEVLERYTDKLMRDLRDNTPEFIAISLNDTSKVQHVPSIMMLKTIPAFGELISSHYYVDKRWDHFILFRRHHHDVCILPYDNAQHYISLLYYWRHYSDVLVRIKQAQLGSRLSAKKLQEINAISDQEQRTRVLEDTLHKKLLREVTLDVFSFL